MTNSISHGTKRIPLSPGGWIVTAALIGILGASIRFAVYGWNLTDAKISTAGALALVPGATVSMALGCCLMALVSWPHNTGYDR